MDDSMDWTQAVINKIRITWTGTEFTPDISKLTFEVEEGEQSIEMLAYPAIVCPMST